MTPEALAEKLMGMTDEVWERHANPWSFWTRMAVTPVLFLALWSHIWLGWWCAIPVGLILIWTWFNPRIFPKPKNTDSWASKCVMGERVYLNRKEVPIPRHHEIAAQITTALSGLFFVIGLYGIAVQDFWAAFLGFHAGAMAKVWFVDRMAWLYEDVTSLEKDDE